MGEFLKTNWTDVELRTPIVDSEISKNTIIADSNNMKENDKKPFDNVTNPAHYVTGKYECIDVMIEVFGAEAVATWCKINAFKYLYRCDRKNGEEDLRKAQWYLNKHNKLIKELKKVRESEE